MPEKMQKTRNESDHPGLRKRPKTGKQVRGTTKMRMTIHVFSSKSSWETFVNMSSPSYKAFSSTEYVLLSEYFGYGPNLDHSWK